MRRRVLFILFLCGLVIFTFWGYIEWFGSATRPLSTPDELIDDLIQNPSLMTKIESYSESLQFVRGGTASRTARARPTHIEIVSGALRLVVLFFDDNGCHSALLIDESRGSEEWIIYDETRMAAHLSYIKPKL